MKVMAVAEAQELRRPAAAEVAQELRCLAAAEVAQELRCLAAAEVVQELRRRAAGIAVVVGIAVVAASAERALPQAPLA